eukprot:jgi/Phyca11/52626/gw1.298.5.1
MRLFWPIRERALSSDSEASTASQSSLVSDASFYSAAADEADLAVTDSPDFPPIRDAADPLVDPLGLGLHTFAPVSSPLADQNGSEEPPRAVPLL